MATLETTTSQFAFSSGALSSGSVSFGGLSSSITPQTSSDLVPTFSDVVSATATPTLSTDGTTSGVLPLSTTIPTLTPSTPTSTLIPTSSSPTFIPQTSTTPSVFSSNLNTPITTTSAPLLQSTSKSVSATEPLVITTIVSVVDGSSTTMTSSLPTTLVNSPSANATSRRMAAIAGATTGSIALILMALGAVFLYRRHKLRKALQSSGQKREGRALLDGEEFDDDVRNVSTSMPSHPYPTHAFHPEAASPLNLIKSRTSDTGSIFREEVWPPPQFSDPTLKQSNQVDLSGTVDDVRGHTSYEPAGSTTGQHGPRQSADASRPLSAISSTSTSSVYSSDASQYSLDPSPSTFEPRAPTSSSLLSLVPPASLNTRPRKSSPLARDSTSDPKLWLTRNVRQTTPP